MPPHAPATTEANHELLISVVGKVDALADVVGKHIQHSASEVDKLWKHVDARDDRLTNAIASLAEKFSSFGRPNISVIVSICGLVLTLGVIATSVAVAFIAPIKADIEREHRQTDAILTSLQLRDEKIVGLKSVQDEVKTKVAINTDKIDAIAEHGSVVTRERLAIIETDLKWMRGERAMKQQTP